MSPVFDITIRRLQIFVVALSILAIAILSYSLISVGNKAPQKGTARDTDTYIVSSMTQCYRAQMRTSCFRDMVKDFLDHFSVKEILAIFSKHEHETEFFSTCHEVAHYLGQEAYKRMNSVGKVYEQADRTCLGGVFHGAIEGYFIKKNLTLQEGNMPQIAQEVANVCDSVKEYENQQYFTQCHHGLGHALMFVTDDDLQKALSLCDNLPATGYQREVCYSGAFMQNADNYGSLDHPRAMIKEDDPLYPCPVLGERYQKTCYTNAILQRYQGNVDKNRELCGMIPQSLRADCFMTFGRDITMSSDNPEVLKDTCAKVNEKKNDEGACIIGVASNLVARYGIEATVPFAFCSTVDAVHRDNCYGAIGRMARTFMTNQDDIVGFCDNIPKAPYRALCMSGQSTL